MITRRELLQATAAAAVAATHGHFLPEETTGQTLAELQAFLSA